jgi:hypothetical protein
MAVIPNSVTVAGFIAPTDSADTYPSHDAIYGKGGLRSVADTTARDAISNDRRSEGMFVYVNDTSTLYVLDSDLTTWNEFSSGGSDTNITDDLTFTAAATTDLDTYGFTIESSGLSALAFFDGANDRVGVGTASPSDLFHVAGDAKVDGVLKLERQAEPTAVAGALYANTLDELFFGIDS